MEKAHAEPINYLTTLNVDRKGEELYFATMCAAGTLKLWEFKKAATEIGGNAATKANGTVGDFVQTGELLFGKNLQEAFQLTTVGSQHLLLVVGGFDKHVHCYTCLRNQFRAASSETSLHDLFTYKLSLTGHMDSIKDLCFTSHWFAMEDKDVQYLASCS